MPRGGFRPGAGRKPGASAVQSVDKPKAAPRQATKPTAKPVARSAPKTKKEKVYDKDGIKTKDAPDNWPFGAKPPPAARTEQAAPPKVELSELMPLDFLLEVMRDGEEDKRVRLQAATLAAPYCHPKKGESSKKDEAAAKAKAAGAGKFSRREPPKLVAAGGQKI